MREPNSTYMTENYSVFLKKAKENGWSEGRLALEWMEYPKTKTDHKLSCDRFLNREKTIGGVTYSVKGSKKLARFSEFLITETIYITKDGEYFRHEINFTLPKEVITPLSESEAESLIKSIKNYNKKIIASQNKERLFYT